ncbi:helix-turn-helix transcriptional regulator [Streptomyces sp900116325]|uniref:helix-turn-helix transcriptional regulator n=1 Tax=Streptomyces sp. 900116325 TaxID=3154295 RepID=UPI00339FD655
MAAIAARAGVSERHLTRLFRAETGMTAAQFVEQIRLEAAQALLESGSDPLDTVARRSGVRIGGNHATHLPARPRRHTGLLRDDSGPRVVGEGCRGWRRYCFDPVAVTGWVRSSRRV